MPKIDRVTPHHFAGNLTATSCIDCGDAAASPQHWNTNLLETLGPQAFHLWYYNRDVWRHVSFMGVYCAKNVLDLWNYQEIIWEIKPELVVEFGTYAGGTALYLYWVMQTCQMHRDGELFPVPCVLTFDIDLRPNRIGISSGPLFVRENSLNSAPIIRSQMERLKDRRSRSRSFGSARVGDEAQGAVLYTLDSDHSKDHVLAELEMLRDLTRPGDYVIVEDSNINGHPVLPLFGPGPWEAIEEYERRHPDDYEHDSERETKFGMTFNPRGYLRRR